MSWGWAAWIYAAGVWSNILVGWATKKWFERRKS